MRLLLILTIVATILQAFRISIYFLRKDVSSIKKIIETVVLISMVILSYFNLTENILKLTFCISTILSLYIFLSFIYEKLFKNEYVSILSVKNGIDLSDTGIMFLDSNDNIILMNNLMSNILKDLNIKENYIDKLINICNGNIDDDYLLKCNNRVFLLKIFDNKEVSLIDITELYKLQEQEKLQNKKIKENNEKLLDAINNIEKIEKNKNLLKIKNEYHDIIGQRLALLTKYLEQDTKDTKSIIFLLDSIYEDFDSKLSSDEKLKNLVKLYQVIGINIIVKGKLPIDEKIANIFFEIIREAVTNAIIHADSKNIKVVITQYLDKTEMIITNDGKKPSPTIYENDGIKGMRRKLTLINGSLNISTENYFVLKIIV
ncbi:MAG: hypothetical protein PUD59_02645 [bacterium]|nr:hypothetical protein [bacterium]